MKPSIMKLYEVKGIIETLYVDNKDVEIYIENDILIVKDRFIIDIDEETNTILLSVNNMCCPTESAIIAIGLFSMHDVTIIENHVGKDGKFLFGGDADDHTRDSERVNIVDTKTGDEEFCKFVGWR